MDMRAIIETSAREQGLDLAGLVRAGDLAEAPDARFYAEWLERGFAGEMNYLKGDKAERRADVSLTLAGVKTVICLALNYNTSAPKSIECPDPSRAWISRYAWGADYHEVLRKKLEEMLMRMRREIPQPFDARVYVDTGPVLERAFARQAGYRGSSGSCTKCIDACPTQAIVAPRVLDSTRCISYWT